MTIEVAASGAAPPTRRPRRLGWGLHRLGHFATDAPWAALVIIAAISALAMFGLTRMQTTSHSLDALFRSDTPEYHRYEAMRAAFPLNERDIFVVVSSTKAFTPHDIATLRDLHLDLQLLDATDSVLSLFSVRGAVDASGYAAPLIPDEVPEGDAFKALMASVAAHPFVAGKLISTNPAGGQTAIIVAGMKADAVSSPHLVAGIDAVEKSVTGMLAGGQLSHELLGVPVMQLDIRLASRSDRWTFNVAGFLIGLAMCLVLFRNARLVAVGIFCPAFNVLWSFGAFGLLGFPISFFMNAIPPLIMVISFAEAMHLTYGIRRRLRDGDTLKAAVHRTVESVGPACVLTTVTTSAAFLSLLISDADVLRDFGISGAISVLLVFVASMLVVPAFAMLILTGKEGANESELVRWATDAGFDRISERLARFAPRYPLPLTVVACATGLLFGALYFSLGPSFRLSEQVPTRMHARIAAAQENAGLAVASPVYVVVRYPAGEAATDARLRSVVGAAHDVLARHARVGGVWSLALIDRERAGQSDAQLSDEVAALPEPLRARLVNEDAHALLVTGHFPDLDAAEMSDELAAIESDLAPLRQSNPDLSIETTGIAAVAALHATGMINDLNQNLTTEIFVVMTIIGLAFRSFTVPLIAFLPNVFPIAASGALLYVLGLGIDYAGIIGLTVAFGLACDDTIHFIHHLEHDRDSGLDLEQAVVKTVRELGPVMLITTLVIMCGVGVTVFGRMPQTRAFGAIVIVTLFSALAAELFLTPALVLAPRAVRRLMRRAPA